MSSKDQEILHLQAELAKLQADKIKLEEEGCKLKSEKAKLEEESCRLRAEKTRLEEEGRKLKLEKDKMQGVIDSLQNQMTWLRKKLFGSMSEKRLPMSPSILEPTLFDMPLPEEEQAALDAEVKKMEDRVIHFQMANCGALHLQIWRRKWHPTPVLLYCPPQVCPQVKHPD